LHFTIYIYNYLFIIKNLFIKKEQIPKFRLNITANVQIDNVL